MAIMVIDRGHGGASSVGGSSSNNATGANGLLEKQPEPETECRTGDFAAADPSGAPDSRIRRKPEPGRSRPKLDTKTGETRNLAIGREFESGTYDLSLECAPFQPDETVTIHGEVEFTLAILPF